MLQASAYPLLAEDPLEQEVVAGLFSSPKTLPGKYLYDAEGSRLFDEICVVPEYYVTRTENALLAKVARSLSVMVPNQATLVEFGSGASIKTRILLDAAPQISHYIPIDISQEALCSAAEDIRRLYPRIELAPIIGDFTRPVRLPAMRPGTPIIGFFPGSTIGNFEPHDAVALLETVRNMLGQDALLIVGADLAKKEGELIPAYDDAQGVTAEFNLNILRRLNRELGADFDVSAFEHVALWNRDEGRVEMHLSSRVRQRVRFRGWTFDFEAGETIHTENSYKYEPECFASLARRAGWLMERTFLNPAPAFGIFALRNGNAGVQG